MTLKLVDRLLVVVLGITLVGTGLGLLAVRQSQAKLQDRIAAVNLRQAIEHYQRVRNTSILLLGARSDYGICTGAEVSFPSRQPAGDRRSRAGQ